MSLPHAQMPRLQRRQAFSRGSIHYWLVLGQNKGLGGTGLGGFWR
jgi:hypothetical protein